MDKWEKLKGRAITACGGILRDPSRYPSREYKGMRVYFCNQDCLREFEEDPDRFMSGQVVHPVGRKNDAIETGLK
jgi:YHS domain-containing protein